MAEDQDGPKKEPQETATGPNFVPIDDPEFTEVITDDLAVDAGEGLQLTRDPEKEARIKQRSEPGIRLSEIGVEKRKKKDPDAAEDEDRRD